MLDALDDLARRHGVHTTTAVTRPVVDADEAAEVMTRLRSNPPTKLCGFDVTMTDLAAVAAVPGRRTDAVILDRRRHEHRVRVAVRPSGTEPKVKSYIEIRRTCVDGRSGRRSGRSPPTPRGAGARSPPKF